LYCFYEIDDNEIIAGIYYVVRERTGSKSPVQYPTPLKGVLYKVPFIGGSNLPRQSTSMPSLAKQGWVLLELPLVKREMFVNEIHFSIIVYMDFQFIN
jgi:hypothetical protein